MVHGGDDPIVTVPFGMVNCGGNDPSRATILALFRSTGALRVRLCPVPPQANSPNALTSTSTATSTCPVLPKRVCCMLLLHMDLVVRPTLARLSKVGTPSSRLPAALVPRRLRAGLPSHDTQRETLPLAASHRPTLRHETRQPEDRAG